MRLHPAPVPSTESGLSSDMRPVKQECFLSARHPPSLSVLAPQQESAKDQGPSITQDFPNKVSGLCRERQSGIRMEVQTITLTRTIQMKERMQALIKAGHHPDQLSMFVAAAAGLNDQANIA